MWRRRRDENEPLPPLPLLLRRLGQSHSRQTGRARPAVLSRTSAADAERMHQDQRPVTRPVGCIRVGGHRELLPDLLKLAGTEPKNRVLAFAATDGLPRHHQG